ncbi:MAG: glycosyltransferase family 39 protein [Tepidisphaeraceae bacterium]|jgi:4-amino-4-deoxy-L-arabinose transferase-like glycosyltransferase
MPTELDQQAGRAFRIFWLMSLLLLALAAYCSPLERSQEARVLETAREMLGGPGEEWIFPRLNGQLRLQKPPLAYWMAASAFKFGDLSVFAGRLPFVLVTVLTPGVVYNLGRRWFSPTAGLVAAALTLASSLYQTYGFLAETDAPSTFFVTAACIGFCDLIDARDKATAMGSSLVAGFCVGMAAMSKGPPAAFPVVLFLLLVAIERKPGALWQFVVHGGLALALMIAVPWWLIVANHPEGHRILNEEVGTLAAGTDHGKAFWYAFPMALKATLPWVAPVIAALIWAFTRKHRGLQDSAPAKCDRSFENAAVATDGHPERTRDESGHAVQSRMLREYAQHDDAGGAAGVQSAQPSGRARPARPDRVRRLLLWTGLIFISLLVMKQKQDHYFFPLIPPLMLLVGAAADAAVRGTEPAGRKMLVAVFGGTTLVAALATPALLLLPKAYGQPLRPVDMILAIGLLAAFVTAFLLYRRSLPAGLLATLFVAPLAMTLVLGVWGPTLKPATFAGVARQIREQHPKARFVLYPEENYRLNFELRRVIPVRPTAQELEETLIENPTWLVIVEESDKPVKPVQIPKRLRQLDKYPMHGRSISVYGVAPEWMK